MRAWWRDGGSSVEGAAAQSSRATSASAPATSAPGAAVRTGFLLVSALDVALLIALAVGEDGPRAGSLAGAAAIAGGHVVLAGFVVAAIVDGGNRLVPRRPWLRAVAAWVVATAVAVLVLIEDYSVFVPAVRVPLTMVTALPFGVLAGVAPRVAARRPLAAAALAAGVALATANPFVLEGGYHGIHLVMTLLAGVLAGLGVWSAAPAVAARRPRAGGLGWAALAVLAASSLVVTPTNAVLVVLARHPTSSIQALSSLVRGERAWGADGVVPREQAPWFVDRSGREPIPPSSPPLHPSPIVILLTVDALRADFVLEPEPSTENLRALASAGASFTQARSPASATSPAMSAMFTGKYYSSLYWTPREVGRGKVKYFIPEETTPRWPSLLAGRGVRRVMVRRKGGFDADSGLIDGMDAYTPEVTWADEIVDRVIAELDRAGPGPLLVYSHVMDPHAPYDSRGKARKAKDGYRKEVAFVDEHVGRLRRAVRDAGLEGRTYLIVTADHGEAFGEHRTRYHAATIYEELVRIPLLVAGPGVVPRSIDEPVSLIDVGPTVLDLFGVETPGHFMGQSLVPLLRGEDVRLTRPIVLDTGRRKQGIVGRDGLKIIRDVREGTVELYDLRRDPGELENLADDRPELAQERLSALAAFFEVHQLRKPGYEIPARD